MAAAALPAILVLGFALRIGVTCADARPYVLFFDETLQYFEQGHRLAFDSGIVPWEFADGVRSWLLPGLIALAMRATAHIGDDPMLYVGLVRTVCVLLSMVVVLIGFHAGEREGGRMGAVVTGGLCAIWFDLIYFAPAVMTEVLAVHCAIAALYLGEGSRTMRRGYWVGALFGAAVCLRYQYAPPLAVAVFWQYRTQPRHYQWLFLGAASVLLPFSGVLDAITWGGAFQSIWLNFIRNSMQGIAAAIGTEPPRYYLDYLVIAWLPLPLLLGTGRGGRHTVPGLGDRRGGHAGDAQSAAAQRSPVHLPYIGRRSDLIGLGATHVLGLLAERHGPRAITFGVPLFLAVSVLLTTYIATGPLRGLWSIQRGMVHAFLAAHREADLCGLQVRDIPSWRSGGYTYLNRDVPLMFDPYIPEVHHEGVSRSRCATWWNGKAAQSRNCAARIRT